MLYRKFGSCYVAIAVFEEIIIDRQTMGSFIFDKRKTRQKVRKTFSHSYEIYTQFYKERSTAYSQKKIER
jgi:hypothetical protein